MANASAQLIGISYSPWTEKARWALDHHQLAYEYHEHLLIFGMPELRWRTGHWRGPLTVPAYRDAHLVCLDSWEIAHRADETGQGTSLFPGEHRERIREYNALSERAISAARVLLSARILADPEAKMEALPSFIPKFMRKALSWLASVGVAYVQREFGYRTEDRDAAQAELRAIWTQLARELKAAGGDYLLGGRLTYADIAMAVTLQGLLPARSGPKIGPALSRCWATSELQGEFQGLLEWRDEVYLRHRNRQRARNAHGAKGNV